MAQVVDLCRGRLSRLTGKEVPVVAAGGIVDGRGLAMALALGAAGVWVSRAMKRCAGLLWRLSRCFRLYLYLTSALVNRFVVDILCVCGPLTRTHSAILHALVTCSLLMFIAHFSTPLNTTTGGHAVHRLA